MDSAVNNKRIAKNTLLYVRTFFVLLISLYTSRVVLRVLGVEVVGGPFRGVRGRVIRARGQQRVLVSLTGFGSVATAYIPCAYLQQVG